MEKTPRPEPIGCKNCKHNYFGACKKNPSRRMNPINGYVIYYSCESINRDGKCHDFEEKSYTIQIISGILIAIMIALCVAASQM